ncbi:MAG: lysylphosphatidylglycerol synthase transmembrane domain-containing protein [Candidatus Binataceae bacterium]
MLQSLLIYAIAIAIVWYVARGVSWEQVVRAMNHATLPLLVVSSLGGFLCWFIGDTILFSRLFTYFHGRTTVLELLPTTTTVYFLQIVNSIVASGAFALFLHTRKRVPWITSGCTLMFQAYVDIMLLAILSITAIGLVPSSPIRPGLDYAAAVLGVICVVTAFWLFWEPRPGFGRLLRWLYERPSMRSFRMARPSHYLKLLAIRFLIFVGAGLALYGQFVSFHIKVPLVQVLALAPFVLAVGNAPISPGGIGTTQFVFTIGFAQFASKNDLLAVSLAATAFNFLFRIPMGLLSGPSLAGEIAGAKREFKAHPSKANRLPKAGQLP